MKRPRKLYPAKGKRQSKRAVARRAQKDLSPAPRKPKAKSGPVDDAAAEMARRYREAAASSRSAAERTEGGESVFSIGLARPRTAEEWRQRANAQDAEAEKLEGK